MQNILSYEEITQDPYKSDACILWCIDARFNHVYKNWVEKENLKNVDLIKFPGGAKVLSESEEDKRFQILAEQTRLSILLHDPDIIYLTTHASCGTYLTEFQFDTLEDEFERQIRDLKLSEENLKKYLEQKKSKVPKIKLVVAGLTHLKIIP